MEKERIYEVSVYKNDVAPGDYYNYKTQHFSPAQDTECIQTEIFAYAKFEVKEKGIVYHLANGVGKNQTWALDCVREKPRDVLLIKGSKILEKRAVEVPRDSERCRVLSVLYKYHAQLLICFSKEISKDLIATFENHLHSIVNNACCSILPPSFINKFRSGYIYPHFMGPGIRFDKLMYGVKEFCSLLQNSKGSTVPVSARVRYPCAKLATDKAVSSEEPVSDGLTSTMRSESNVVLRTKSIASSSTDTLPNVHLDGNQKKGSIGHGVTKSNGVKSETANTPGRNAGRGRGTMTGRGKSSVAPVSLNSKDTRIRVGENETREPVEVSMDQEIQSLCNNLIVELRNTSLKSDNTKIKDLTGDTSVVNIGQSVELDTWKSQNSVGKEERSFHKQYEERKEIDMVSDRTCMQPVCPSACISNANLNAVHKTNYLQAAPLTDQPLEAHGENSSYGSNYQNKDSRAPHNNGSEILRRDHGQVNISIPGNQVVAQQKIKKDQVFHKANSFSGGGLANGEATATMVVEFSNKLDGDIAKTPDSDTLKFEKIQSEDRSSKKNGVEKSESVAQKSKKPKKTSVPESEFSESSVHRPDVSTRELVKREIGPGNEIHKLNHKKPEINTRKSENTKKDTTSRISSGAIKKKEVASKEHNLSNRLPETAQKSENATKNVGPKREIKNGNVKTWDTAEKCKNPKKEADPKHELRELEVKSQGRKAPNVSQNKQKLYQGLGCDDEDEESSLLKIGNQKIFTDMRNKKCKEQHQMKSTFLEATKTHDDLLGFQRKYYGVINDSSLEKVILLLGASGSGKTTIVNLAANYFKEKKSADEELCHVVSTSPTSDITAFTFCSAVDEIPITIIDTPGLNDSSGAEVQDHIQALKTFLANASANDFQIHAIGFVAQAYLVRLTSSERLVMDYVSSLFGQGVKDHLITLVTFADNQDSPPVVEAMRNYGVGFKLSLKFNNSALHNSKADEVDDIDRVYWRVCWRNWKKCLKVLRDLPPLSASTMKAVQNEVFASTVLKSAERDLRVGLRTFFAFSEKDRIMSKEGSQFCAEIWNLATVLHHFRGLNSSPESILTELALEICKTQQIPAEENVYFLSLIREKPLVVSGLEVIRIMAPMYKEAKSWHTKTAVLGNVMLMYCHHCEEEHTAQRFVLQGLFKKITRSGEDVLSFKCNICKCPGDVHDVCESKSPFHLDEVLSRTCDALRKIIAQYSIPNFPVSEHWYLKFLDHPCYFEHSEFINDILHFMKQ